MTLGLALREQSTSRAVSRSRIASGAALSRAMTLARVVRSRSGAADGSPLSRGGERKNTGTPSSAFGTFSPALRGRRALDARSREIQEGRSTHGSREIQDRVPFAPRQRGEGAEGG